MDDLVPGELDAGVLVVRCADRGRTHYLQERCAGSFAEIAGELTGHLVTVRFETSSQPLEAPREIAPAERPRSLDADYVFDEFVVGPSNRLAHAACRAVSNEPGAAYNPLFIYGPSGVGKSHLLQATCAEIMRARPHFAVVYLSCETFVNEFINGIESGRVQQFRDRHRQADVLAIDDVQFLVERETSQEEFFHTFNVLHQARKQIMLSADVSPRQIPTLEDRLVSRFNWGLVTHIDFPDLETRRAILQKKARLRGYVVADEILDLIAERVASNIRLLEGALIRAVSQAQLSGQELTREAVVEMLDESDGQRRRLPIRDIIETVSSYYGVRLGEMLGRKRTRSVAQPRQIGMYLARRLTGLSLEEIGGHFGGRDHSTVLHAENAIESLRRQDRETDRALTTLTNRLLQKR
ncbi:MAG: Chromosomal replication initiator protein DnaA [Phycisphaerae bacterium]|nr:Chromosomal replication initiator protein DnaA [Phycisphaerae bacterium]